MQFPVCGAFQFEEKEISRAISSALLLRDYPTAIQLSDVAIDLFPQSKNIQSLKVSSLAKGGFWVEALTLFHVYFSSSPIKETFRLLETIMWEALLCDEEKSEMARCRALIGASLTNDCRFIDLLMRSLDSKNVLVRKFSTRVAAQYGDKIVQKKLLQMLQEEKNIQVRLEVLKNIGNIKSKEVCEILRRLVAFHHISQEERLCAICALTQLYEEVSESDLQFLLYHERSGFRELGVALIDQFLEGEKLADVIPLLKDSSLAVRHRVLALFGTKFLQKEVLALVRPTLLILMDDPHPYVSMLSSWVVMLQIDKEMGQKNLLRWIMSEDLATARLAAAIVHVDDAVFTIWPKIMDPYVKVNFAVNMIRQKVFVDVGVEYIKNFFLTNKEKIMWSRGLYPMFQVLEPSRVNHIPNIPNYPLVVDQLSRLYLLNVLCLYDCKDIEILLRDFLSGQVGWALYGASALLLAEGQENAIEFVRKLLDVKDEFIRLQAALILAFYGKDPSVARILEKSYYAVDWEKRTYILEAIGAIGNRESIPFLLQIMREPFGLSRVIAASSLIQCLYH